MSLIIDETNFIKLGSPLRMRKHTKITDAVRSFRVILMMSLNSHIVTDSVVEQHDSGSAIFNIVASLPRALGVGNTVLSFVTISKVQREMIETF